MVLIFSTFLIARYIPVLNLYLNLKSGNESKVSLSIFNKAKSGVGIPRNFASWYDKYSLKKAALRSYSIPS